MLIFLGCGLAYGLVTRRIRSDRDVAQMASESMGLGLAVVAGLGFAYTAAAWGYGLEGIAQGLLLGKLVGAVWIIWRARHHL
jgi:hypothetical protein